MKYIYLLLSLLITILSNAYGQNLNPYEELGYKTKNQYVRTKKDDGLWLNNPNQTAKNKQLLINAKSRQIYALNSKDSIISVADIPADVLAKFLSVDPLSSGYPFYSPYHFAGNSPIENIDLDGLEPQTATRKWTSGGEGGPFNPNGDNRFAIVTYNKIYNGVKNSTLPVAIYLNNPKLIGGNLEATYTPAGKLVDVKWTGYREKTLEERFMDLKGSGGPFKTLAIGNDTKFDIANGFKITQTERFYATHENSVGLDISTTVMANGELGAEKGKGLITNMGKGFFDKKSDWDNFTYISFGGDTFDKVGFYTDLKAPFSAHTLKIGYFKLSYNAGNSELKLGYSPKPKLSYKHSIRSQFKIGISTGETSTQGS